MAKEMWDPPAVADEDVPLSESERQALEGSIVAAYGDGCEDLWLFELTRETDDRYQVGFVRTFDEPTRTEKFECVARPAEADHTWTLLDVDQIAVATVGRRDRRTRISPSHLQTPLDLTDAEYERLDQALQSQSEEYRNARTRPPNSPAPPDRYHGAIYYVGRSGPDSYDVLFYAKYPQKPGWTWQLRTEASRDPTGDQWELAEIEVEKRYHWL